MRWECDMFGQYTGQAEGLQFVLEPTDWSIWDLDQCKASAEYLAAQRASGLNPWTNGALVRLHYRDPAAQVDGAGVQIATRRTKGGFNRNKKVPQ